MSSMGNVLQTVLRIVTYRSEIEKMWPRVQKAQADINDLWPKVQATMQQTMTLANDVQKLVGQIAPHLEIGGATAPKTEPVYDVRWVQQSLKSLGYDPGPVDGIMGDRTKEAIARFQQASGLVADGWAGVATTAALDALMRRA